MKRALASVSIVLLATTALAVDKKKVAYVGGTLEGVKEKIEGTLVDISGESFQWKIDKTGTVINIPYARFIELEYGQKAGHRVKTAILLSPIALFKKSRHHYVTITFKDAQDKEQAGVFEFGKEIIRTDLKVMSVRSGQPIHFTDEDSQKNFGK